ncbi:MAG: HAMP domain-containing histidine kinase [Chromatiales bacterium]|nr:MAG: HAMP domain-containing histidine kinase [Chromatiales bacterium]
MNTVTAPLATPIAPTPVTPEAPGGLNVRRLLWIRMIAVPGAALCLLLARQVYGLGVPALQLALIVGGLVAINFVSWWRHRGVAPVTDRQFFIQLLVDLFALTSILYYSGGAANPFVYFFLLPMAISAAALPQAYTWVIALISAASYTALMLWRVEVPEFNNFHTTSAMDLHAVGMWVGFVVLSALFATFVSAMAQTVREQDRHLARLRENVLRDERVVAVATLAAGAAHELSTPLATMAVVTGEISREYPQDSYPALHRDLGILRDQIARCKEALSVISASAGAARADSAERLALDRFVRQAADEVRHLRPGSTIALATPTSEGSPPLLIVGRTFRQALLNILHNAVDVSPRHVRLTYEWNSTELTIAIIDRGGGLVSGDPALLERFGTSTKEGGLGLGLFLSHAAITQAGGSLEAVNNDEGGTTVRLKLPLARPMEGFA